MWKRMSSGELSMVTRWRLELVRLRAPLITTGVPSFRFFIFPSNISPGVTRVFSPFRMDSFWRRQLRP